MATLLDFLTERDQYYPIYELLSSHLRIAEIIALTRTCRKLSHLYQELLPVFWDIDWFLRRFVDDPYEFRGQMKQHNAFLSGQFAYGFFKGEPGEGRPIMDILIHVRDRDAFVQYLLQVEGYEIGTPGHGDVDEDARLSRKDFHGSTLSQIDVFVTEKPPLRMGITTTGSVNVIAWNKAYSIFPQSDFVDRANWSFADLKVFAEEHLHELNTHWRETHDTGNALVYKHPNRHVGDRLTWTISFDTSKVPTTATTTPHQEDDYSPAFQLPYTPFGAYQLYNRDPTAVTPSEGDKGVEHLGEDNDSIVDKKAYRGACWVVHVYHPELAAYNRIDAESVLAVRRVELTTHTAYQSYMLY